jgi:hypothetical protein
VRSLSDFEPEELAALADADFRETVVSEARSQIADAFDTYHEVMTSSDDDQARVKAADRIVALSGFEEKQTALPSGVSEEVFKLALAGLGQLAGIARASAPTDAIFRNVTPAATDPRLLPSIQAKDDSPMNVRAEASLAAEDDNAEIAMLFGKERYEIIDRKS